MVVVRGVSGRPRVYDGTARGDPVMREDLAIFLRGWHRYRVWAVREEPAVYDARLAPLLARLEAHLEALRHYAAMAPAEFLADAHKSAAGQLHLFGAFVAVLESSKWLAGKVRLRGRPRTFADAFDLLVAAGVLPEDGRNLHVGLARLRNWLAHEAVLLPASKVRALARFYLPHLEEWARHLRRFSPPAQSPRGTGGIPPGRR